MFSFCLWTHKLCWFCVGRFYVLFLSLWLKFIQRGICTYLNRTEEKIKKIEKRKEKKTASTFHVRLIRLKDTRCVDSRFTFHMRNERDGISFTISKWIYNFSTQVNLLQIISNKNHLKTTIFDCVLFGGVATVAAAVTTTSSNIA